LTLTINHLSVLQCRLVVVRATPPPFLSKLNNKMAPTPSRFVRWSIRTTILLLLLLSTNIVVHSSEIGKPHDTVIPLTDENFESHLNDPSNGLWLLKFYAPWCGHCKQLEPKLDQAAPYLSGKMAIGKIDCTASTNKSLCKRFEIRGYPTLKFYRDGDFYDYPGGRTIDAIIDFGEKMSSSAVVLVKSAAEVMDQLVEKNMDGVAFLAYDPAAAAFGKKDDEKEVELDEFIQSTKLTQVFGQVARKMQAQASFGLLSSDIAPAELQTLGLDKLDGAFLVKIEKDILHRPKVYKGDINSLDYLNFVKENNVALVSLLGPHNFRTLTTMGKPLAIGVYDPEGDEAKSKEFEKELKSFALDGPNQMTEKYHFALMDGKKWGKFVSQFSIESDALPDIFILNAEEKTYWQDATITSSSSGGVVSAFFKAMENGEIESRKQSRGRAGGPFGVVIQAFLDNLPYSAIALAGIIFAFFAVFYFSFDDYPDDEPEQMTVAQRKHAEAIAAAEKESSEKKEEIVEGKKDK